LYDPDPDINDEIVGSVVKPYVRMARGLAAAGGA
jgi:hypothetical protein